MDLTYLITLINIMNNAIYKCMSVSSLKALNYSAHWRSTRKLHPACIYTVKDEGATNLYIFTVNIKEAIDICS